MSNYSIKKIDSEEKILRFWEQSPHATVFTHPFVLPKLVPKVEWWMAYSGTQELCLWPICSQGFRGGGVSKFAYYIGPFWSRIRQDIPFYRWLEMSRKVYREYINEFISKELIFESSFLPRLNDMREFIWMNKLIDSSYHLAIIPRYTAVINNLDLKSEESLIREMKKDRRKDILNFKKQKHLQESTEFSPKELFDLYRNYFEIRGYEVPNSDFFRIETLCSLVNEGFGYITGLRESKTNQVVSVQLVLHCKKVANAVFNFTREDYRDFGLSTIVILKALKNAKDLGLSSFDFNGANSEGNSFFKHSLGAEPLLYFDLNVNCKI